jgi:DNA-binding FadR family transcriptional regulator
MTADATSRLVSNKAGDAAGEKATFKAGAVYETLKRRILDGTYPPGDWLRLSQLARDFSLSEMPIREALRLLQKDGLVVLHRHRGAQVAELSLARATKSSRPDCSWRKQRHCLPYRSIHRHRSGRWRRPLGRWRP